MGDKDRIKQMEDWVKYGQSKVPPGIEAKLGRGYEKWNIQYLENFGRCLVALEDIAEGDMLYIDQPVITGPKQASEVMCLGCYRQLDPSTYYSCSKCGWPMCSEICEKVGYHYMECEVFSASKFAPTLDDFNDEEQTPYECILPLRSFLLQKHIPELWKTFIAMESHNDLRRVTELWRTEHVRVNTVLRDTTKLDFEDELMHTCTGVLDVNCHEVRSNIPGTNLEFRVRGLYPLTAMMSHDCTSNTHHTVLDDLSMVVVASTNIKKGQQVTGTYTHLLSGTIERRKHLKYGKLFDCSCKRCSDPTELETNFSSLLCSQSHCGGTVINSDPLNPNNNSDFVCKKCGFCVKSNAVTKLTNMVQYELIRAPDNDPLQLEAIYNKFKTILHPNHFHLTGISHSLSQMYGRVENYLLNDLSEKNMNRKIECCRHLLQIIEKLDPGISRLRGLTLYELHAPILLRANKCFQAKLLSKSDFLCKLGEALTLLNMTVHNLQFEPASSFEGEICKIAQRSSEELSKWIEIVKGLSNDNFLQQTLPSPTPTLSDEDLTLEYLLNKLNNC